MSRPAAVRAESAGNLRQPLRRDPDRVRCRRNTTARRAFREDNESNTGQSIRFLPLSRVRPIRRRRLSFKPSVLNRPVFFVILPKRLQAIGTGRKRLRPCLRRRTYPNRSCHERVRKKDRSLHRRRRERRQRPVHLPRRGRSVGQIPHRGRLHARGTGPQPGKGRRVL